VGFEPTTLLFEGAKTDRAWLCSANSNDIYVNCFDVEKEAQNDDILGKPKKLEKMLGKYLEGKHENVCNKKYFVEFSADITFESP
jgi:hypothetical protein